MACREFEFVESFVRGRLAPEAVAAMEVHVELCEPCLSAVAEAMALLSDEEKQAASRTSNPRSRLSRFLRGDSSLGEAEAKDGPSPSHGPDFKIGDYLVTGLLGTGGMGVVYRARQVGTGRVVALKAVRAPRLASFASLRQEIEFLKGAHHPDIVRVLDYDLAAGDPWYAMELLEGQTLADFNRTLWRGEEPPGQTAAAGRLIEVLRLYAALCEPLAFVHRVGIVHCDLKPSNVFLRENGRPVLMDFGLVARARGAVGREALAVTSRIRGTFPYMAPELIRGQIPDGRADVYALGCMLFETVTGLPPFTSNVGEQILDQHKNAPVPVASARVRGVPPALDELLQRMLAKRQGDRFGHVVDLATALKNLVTQLGMPAASAPESIRADVPAEAQLFRPALVGREDELDRLSNHVLAARRGAGKMVLISGESGIGKTFLATEICQRALLAGVHVITGECAPHAPSGVGRGEAGTVPLQPFGRLLEAIRDHCREHGAKETERILGRRRGLLAAYAPGLRQLEGTTPAAPPEQLPALAARERLLAAFAETLARFVDGRPLVVAIDDLQWADDLTLAVLQHLDESFFGRTPLVLLATYRSDEATTALSSIAARPWVENANLGRLGRDQVARMVAGMLSIATPPESLLDFVEKHAEGIPFFAAEYLRALVGDGTLRRGSGAWIFEPQSGDAVPERPRSLPDALAELIRRRVDRLSPEAFEALGAAAVVGRRFRTPLLQRVLGTTAPQIAEHLSQAASLYILEPGGAGEHGFLHDKIRETIYRTVDVAARTRHHLGVAQALAEEGSGGAEHRYGEVAHHFRAGGDLSRAQRYLDLAGVQALSIGANADAVRFFREALALDATIAVPSPALRRVRWMRQLGEALQGLGMMAESAEALRSAAAELGRPLPSGKGSFAWRMLIEVQRQALNRLFPSRTRRRRAGDAAEVLLETTRVFDRLLQASYYLGRDQDLLLSAVVSLNVSELTPPAPEQPIAYANAAMMAAVLPAPKLAERYFRLAAATMPESDPATESWLNMHEGVYRMGRGDRERAIVCLERTIALSEQLGFFRRLDESRSARANIDLLAGRTGAVLARIGDVEADAARRGDPQLLSWVLLQRAECCLMAGQTVPASVRERLARLRSEVGRPEHIWMTSVDAYLAWREGDRDTAVTLVEAAAKLIEKGPPAHVHCVTSYARLAEVAIALWSSDESRARARTGSAVKRACLTLTKAARIFPVARPLAALHVGLASLLAGKYRRAIGLWQRGILLAHEMSLPYHQGRLHRALADNLPAGDPRQGEHSTQAHLLISEEQSTLLPE